MSIALSFSQLFAVMAQVERSALSGGLVVARPEDAALLVFDRGVLLHAEVTRARGRVINGPAVLDELVGRRQAALTWVWPEAEEEAPAPTVTRKDANIFRGSLKMLVRYGYFDDPQATAVKGDFFGVPDEALAQAEAAAVASPPEALAPESIASVPEPQAAESIELFPVTPRVVTASAPVKPTVSIEAEAAETPETSATPADAPWMDAPVLLGKVEPKIKGGRSVIANPQTALGKLIFNGLRPSSSQDDDKGEKNGKS